MAFTKINPDAVIYMQESAGDDYYADDGENVDITYGELQSDGYE